jgi:hypothetical protein
MIEPNNKLPRAMRFASNGSNESFVIHGNGGWDAITGERKVSNK